MLNSEFEKRPRQFHRPLTPVIFFQNSAFRIQHFRRSSFLGHDCSEFLEGQTIDHVLFFDPGAAGDVDAELHGLQACGGVGVGVDGEFDAGGDGGFGVNVVEVQPRPGCIDFQGGSGSGGGAENPLKIQG
jgi:hypothetical protein